MQPYKTGDQPYSDASPNGECSLPTCDNNKCLGYLKLCTVRYKKTLDSLITTSFGIKLKFLMVCLPFHVIFFYILILLYSVNRNQICK